VICTKDSRIFFKDHYIVESGFVLLCFFWFNLSRSAGFTLKHNKTLCSSEYVCDAQQSTSGLLVIITQHLILSGE
jgi:hypothetical protein